MRMKIYGKAGQSHYMRLPPTYVKEHKLIESKEIELIEDAEGRIILIPKDVQENLSTMNKLRELQEFMAQSKLKIQEVKDVKD